MKKFINDPDNLVDELLEGYAAAYPEYVEIIDRRIVLNRALEGQDRVAVVSIGGSGHEPAACGFVGNGMIDAFVAGEIFVAPGADAAFKAVQLADRGKGVLLIVLNHPGDLLTGERVVEMCEKQGIAIRKIITQEDISSAPRSDAANRRGLVGCIPAYKIAGAAAAAGKNLDEVAEVTQRFVDQMATLAVGVRGATHPASGQLLVEFGEDDMEIGMGQHGEEGGGRMKLRTADETAVIVAEPLLGDLKIKRGDQVMLIVNGMGSTTLMELFLIYRKAASYLAEKGIEIVADSVGNLLTVQEAAGFQMFMARMDDELTALWNAPCDTAYFKVLSSVR